MYGVNSYGLLVDLYLYRCVLSWTHRRTGTVQRGATLCDALVLGHQPSFVPELRFQKHLVPPFKVEIIPSHESKEEFLPLSLLFKSIEFY